MTSWHQTNLREVCNFVSFIIAAEAFSNFTHKNLFFHWLATIKKKGRQKNLRFTLSNNRCTTNENYCFSAFFFFPETFRHTSWKKLEILKKCFFPWFSEQYNFPHISISIFWNPKWAQWAHITGEKFATIPGKNLEREPFTVFFFSK